MPSLNIVTVPVRHRPSPTRHALIAAQAAELDTDAKPRSERTLAAAPRTQLALEAAEAPEARTITLIERRSGSARPARAGASAPLRRRTTARSGRPSRCPRQCSGPLCVSAPSTASLAPEPAMPVFRPHVSIPVRLRRSGGSCDPLQCRVGLPQHRLYFFPDPQAHGSLRPIFGTVRR
jgi:hypothetical protein